MSELTDHVRLDAYAKASGRVRYTEDLHPPGMLHGVVVRSAHAAAVLRAVDIGAAARAPGVIAALGPDDVPTRRFGDVVHDEPLLAQGRVHYVGEPLALIAAETLSAARAAAQLVAIDYEPVAAAITLEEALAEGAPQVHPGEPNVGKAAVVRRGDLERAFAEAHAVVETTIDSQRVNHGYIELRSALAEVEPDGRLVVTMPSQAPYAVRKTLARVFGLPMTSVTVRVPAFGGGFGGKLHDGMAPYAAALALATQRPVRVVCSREEELQAANPRENATVTMRSAVAADGRILGRRSVAHLDSGAYAIDTPLIQSLAALHCSGPYDIAAVEGIARQVATNTQGTGSFRAPTGPELCFAYETHIDDIADRLGIDRVELRRRNIMRPGSRAPSGQVVQTPAMETALDKISEIVAGWRAGEAVLPEGPWRRGYGVGCTWYYTARGPSGANLRVNEDGTVSVHTGATEIGTGAVVGGLRALVAEDLGLRPQDVALVSGDTDHAPADMGSEGSRTLYGAGNAVLGAAAEVRRILADTVSDELEANPEDIVFREGRVMVVGSPSRSMTIAEAAAAATIRTGPVVGSGRFMNLPWDYDTAAKNTLKVPAFNDPGFHCHAAEVAVDAELGTLKILRYAAVHDTGTVIYRPGVMGQLEGGILQGIGYALYEEILVDAQGFTRNPNLVDYRLPTIADIPDELTIVTLEDFPSTRGPRGAKGVAESPILLPAATLASAVRDAVGARVTELPLTAERIADALEDDMLAKSRG